MVSARKAQLLAGATRGLVLAESADLVRSDRASEPFELEVAGRRRLDRLLHGREQALADQDLARGRLDAEP